MDLNVNFEAYQVAAHFKGLAEGVLVAPLDSRYTQVGFNLISVQVCNSSICVLEVKMHKFLFECGRYGFYFAPAERLFSQHALRNVRPV